jgi:ELWxxDGT repeat protein
VDLDPRLLDINKAGIGSAPSDFTAVGATTFFLATDNAHGREIYKTDGTEEGTRLVKDINPGPADSNIHGLTALNGLLLFFANDGVHGEELWRSNGTEKGTRLVDDINPGPGNSTSASASLNTTVVFQGKMFFSADDGVHGRELWETDGTAAGTSLVADINPGAGGSNPSALTTFNGKLYFQAAAGGSQLWASDGTASGTSLVKILNPTGDASPSDFTAFGEALFFAANDGTHGSQLWMSDGTETGTTTVAQLNPDGTSFPYPVPTEAIANVNGSLYFGATDGVHGFEPWVIPADQLEDLGHRDGGHHHEDGEPSGRDHDRGHGGSALAAALSAGQRAVVTPDISTSDIPPVAVAPTSDGSFLSERRTRPNLQIAPPGFPQGPFGRLRPRVLQDLTPGQRISRPFLG